MTNKEQFNGIVIPAVTPLTKEFKLDYSAVERMFGYFHQNQVMPFINGTTGESASLSFELKKDYILSASKLKKPGTMLYAGISANCIEESITLANIGFDAGVDAVAATLPSYYSLSEDQMLKYFNHLAQYITGPIIIYNIPVTTRMSIPLHIIDELSHRDNIIGTKDSERSEDRLKSSLQLWSGRKDFCHFLGWAPKSAEALINGSDGLIPSSGNLCPHIYHEMYKAVKGGNLKLAHHFQTLSDYLGDVYQKGRLLGESLWALKVCMNELEICQEYVMPPLTPLTDEEKDKVLGNLRHVINEHNLSTKSTTNV